MAERTLGDLLPRRPGAKPRVPQGVCTIEQADGNRTSSSESPHCSQYKASLDVGDYVIGTLDQGSQNKWQTFYLQICSPVFEVFRSVVKRKMDNEVSFFFSKPKWSGFPVVGTYSRNVWMNDLNVQASWQGHLSQCWWPAWIWLVQLAGRGSSSSLAAPPRAGETDYLLR